MKGVVLHSITTRKVTECPQIKTLKLKTCCKFSVHDKKKDPTAFISRTHPFPLAPILQRVSVISCKIVTVLILINLVNSTVKGVCHKLGNYGQIPGL